MKNHDLENLTFIGGIDAKGRCQIKVDEETVMFLKYILYERFKNRPSTSLFIDNRGNIVAIPAAEYVKKLLHIN